MRVKIFQSLQDPVLKRGWELIEESGAVFPQNTWHWCSTWWRYLAAARKPYVLAVEDGQGRLLAVLPMCLERFLWGKVLRSFPVNYGDFFEMATMPGLDRSRLFDIIEEHLTTVSGWDVVVFSPVATDGLLGGLLEGRNYKRKRFSDCVVSDLKFNGWEEYIGAVSGKNRRQTMNKLRRLERQHQVEYEFITDPLEYQNLLPTLVRMHAERATTDDRPMRSTAYLACVKETNVECLRKGKMALSLLRADRDPIAYRMGFLHEGTFFDWNTSYDKRWERFSPGLLSLVLTMRYLVENGYRSVNFMAGAYEYKQSWSPVKEIAHNDTFVLKGRSLLYLVFVGYHWFVRDVVKRVYHLVRDQIASLRRFRGGLGKGASDAREAEDTAE